MTVGELRRQLEGYPDDHQIVGQALTPEGTWLNYPVEVAKVPGNNTMVVIQLKPLPGKDHE